MNFLIFNLKEFKNRITAKRGSAAVIRGLCNRIQFTLGKATSGILLDKWVKNYYPIHQRDLA